MTQSDPNVQRLLCDKDAIKQIVEEAIQRRIEEEFEKQGQIGFRCHPGEEALIRKVGR